MLSANSSRMAELDNTAIRHNNRHVTYSYRGKALAGSASQVRDKLHGMNMPSRPSMYPISAAFWKPSDYADQSSYENPGTIVPSRL
jgi:hypothetical protein